MEEKMCEINDSRLASEFKGKTFSNFKQTDVKHELLNSLIQSKIEPACYWSAEMICSGHFSEIWEIIIHFYSKYIHIANYNVAIYIEMRLTQFKEILYHGYTAENELQLRNHNKIRHIFMELVSILCLTKRKYTITHATLKDGDFDMSNMSDKMHANHLNYGKNVFLEEDPQEMYIAINELAYNISLPVRNAIYGSYWLEWGIEYDRRCRRRKEKCECQRREEIDVHSDFQKNTIWVLWNVLMNESKKRSAYVQKIVHASLTIFCLRFTNSIPQRRKFILHFIITLLCENEVTPVQEIIDEKYKQLIASILMKKNVIYQQIKRNEHVENEIVQQSCNNSSSSNTNLRDTLRKLEILQNF